MAMSPVHPKKMSDFRCVIRCKDVTNPDNLQIMVWGSHFAARKYIEAILEGYEWEQISDNVIEADSGAVITCEEMNAVLDYEYTKEEEEYKFRGSDARAIRIFRGEDEPAKENGPDNDAPTTSTRKSTPRAKRTKRKAAPANGKTIGEIADKVGIPASKARAILRKNKIDKPEAGWVWEDAAPIIKILKENK